MVNTRLVVALFSLSMLCPSAFDVSGVNSSALLNSERIGLCTKLCGWLCGKHAVDTDNHEMPSQDRVNIFTVRVGIREEFVGMSCIADSVSEKKIYTIAAGLSTMQGRKFVEELVKEQHFMHINIPCMRGYITRDGITTTYYDFGITITLATTVGLRCIYSQQSAKQYLMPAHKASVPEKIEHAGKHIIKIKDELPATSCLQKTTISALLATGGITYQPLIRS